MFLDLSTIDSFVVLATHPDDEALGCSGTIMLLNERGADSLVVYLTRGEKLYGTSSPDIAARRRQEAVRSSGMLGCKEAVFLDFPDGETGRHREDIYRRLYKLLEINRPDIVFSPSPIDYHQDHTATAEIALKLFNRLKSFRLAFYEVYSTVRFSHLVDIAEKIDKKREVIMNYQTSLYGKPGVYVHATLGLNAQRSIFTQVKGYYEAFYVLKDSAGLDDVLAWLSYR
ncbi:MAG TPA: PIG-L family deacetylase [Nitrospirae bacterium]|nr:PIG-L family deacetylase [Nitrospirota bacterium]